MIRRTPPVPPEYAVRVATTGFMRLIDCSPLPRPEAVGREV